MSSIVSLRPPPSVSTNQANDFFWMSIRLGTSSTLSRRAKLRRVRGASREAKTATPHRDGEREGRPERPRLESRGRSSATSQDSTGGRVPLGGALGAHGPRPRPVPVCGGRAYRWTAATIGRVLRSVAPASTADACAHPARGYLRRRTGEQARQP